MIPNIYPTAPFSFQGGSYSRFGVVKGCLPKMWGPISLKNWYEINDSRYAADGLFFIPRGQLLKIWGRHGGAYSRCGARFPCQTNTKVMISNIHPTAPFSFQGVSYSRFGVVKEGAYPRCGAIFL